MFPLPRFFSSPRSLSLFLPPFFFLIYLAFSCSPSLSSTRCSLPLQLTSCLSSVFFNFLAVFHLCCCAPFNLSWSILAPPLVPDSLLPRSWVFRPRICSFSPTVHSWSPLMAAYSAATKKHATFAFKPYCIQEIIMELPCLLTLWSGQHEMVSNSPSSLLLSYAFPVLSPPNQYSISIHVYVTDVTVSFAWCENTWTDLFSLFVPDQANQKLQELLREEVKPIQSFFFFLHYIFNLRWKVTVFL